MRYLAYLKVYTQMIARNMTDVATLSPNRLLKSNPPCAKNKRKSANKRYNCFLSFASIMIYYVMIDGIQFFGYVVVTWFCNGNLFLT